MLPGLEPRRLLPAQPHPHHIGCQLQDRTNVTLHLVQSQNSCSVLYILLYILLSIILPFLVNIFRLEPIECLVLFRIRTTFLFSPSFSASS
jgi:hypothetical protein